jgi:hypothetical protein
MNGNTAIWALLLSGMAGLPLFFVLDWTRRVGRARRSIPVIVAADMALVFLASFLVLQAFQAHREPPVEAEPDMPLVEINMEEPPERSTPLEVARWTARNEGYRLGYDLATGPHHRGGKVPPPAVLDAMANIRCQGRGEDFVDGFKAGYVAGLNRPVTAAPAHGKERL